MRSRWDSLRRITLERLVHGRRAWSGEHLAASGVHRDSYTSADLLAPLLPGQSRPLPRFESIGSRLLPRYDSIGSCKLCRQTGDLWERGLNHSAPSVYSPVHTDGRRTEGTC